MPKKLTQEQFLQKVCDVHGNKYDYSKTVFTRTRDKIIIVCPKHGEFKQEANSHLLGSGCRRCSSEDWEPNNKVDFFEFLKRAKKKFGNKFQYDESTFSKITEKIEIICPIHGRFLQTPSAHLYSTCGCQICAKDSAANSKKKGLGFFIQKSIMVHGEKYDYSKSKLDRLTDVVEIICPKHGSFFQKASSHMKGNQCQKCSGTYKRSVDDFIIDANVIHNNKYDYSLVSFSSTEDTINIICPVHGLFKQVCKVHLSGSGCRKCGYIKAGKSGRLTKEDFIKRSKKRHGDKYDYSLVEYRTIKENVKIVCQKHGSFHQTPDNHLYGKGCPSCGIPKSEIETRVKMLLSKNHITFVEKSRSIIPPNELDFYLPDHNLAIECNGIFWHSEKVINNNNYHINKTKKCNDAGIRLLHFFENEIMLDWKKVESKIRSILGFCHKGIYARKCFVENISVGVKNKFLNKYHIQRSDKSNIKLGLFYKNRLVAVMTFCKPRVALGGKNNVESWELSRYATINSFNIVGGAGKLLKYFERNYNPKIVKSYADIRYSSGNMYYKVGFNLVGTSKPSYFYFNDNERLKLYHRFNFRKSVLKNKLENFDPNLTEWENMKNNGWNRIWDCGCLVFEKKYE